MEPSYGSRLMPVVVDEVARDQPHLPYALIPLTANVEDGFKPITFLEIANAVNRVCGWIYSKLGNSSRFETIAYMGPGDLRYVVVFLAAIKCGYKVLLPSLRNSAPTNVSLLEQTQCIHVLYALEVEAIVAPLVREGPSSKIRLHKVQSLNELIQAGVKHYLYDKKYDEAKWDPILILHSSGSTGPPKPIHMNHATFAVGDHDRKLPVVPGRVNQNWAMWDFAQKEPFFSAFPAFHLAGFSSMVLLPIYYTNATLVLGPPSRPPTGHILNRIMKQFPLKAIFCPPIIAEQLLQEPDSIERCKSLKFLLFAGGPLSQPTGDALSKVTDVCQFYGQTETGPIQALVPSREDWASLEWHPMQEAFMEPSIDGAYEMVLKRNPALEKVRSISCNFPDVEVWHSKDLFHQHPTRPGVWMFYGRTDDIIVLSNGEKFNPIPSETYITAHPLLDGAIIAGQGHPQPCLIVEPSDHSRDFDALIAELWPIIEEANYGAQGHGKITRRMVICATPSKPFDRTAKGTVIRRLTVQKYEKEISRLYLADVSTTVNPIALRPMPDLAAAINFVRNVITYAFPSLNAEDDEDLFFLGLDSLQVAEMISLMRSGIRSGSPRADISWINTKTIYERASIDALAWSILDHTNPIFNLQHTQHVDCQIVLGE